MIEIVSFFLFEQKDRKKHKIDIVIQFTLNF